MGDRNPTLPLIEITVHKNNKSASRETRNMLLVEEAQVKSQQGSVRDLLEELKEVMTVNDTMAAVEEFVKEFEDYNINNGKVRGRGNESAELSEMQLTRMGVLQEECYGLKQEAAVYRSKKQKMREQLKVEEGTIDSLEIQIADLKKTLCQLTQYNTELLRLVLGQLHDQDHIFKLEDERALMTEHVRSERFFSSALHQKLLTSNAEAAAIKAISVIDLKEANQGPTLLQKIKSHEEPSSFLAPSKSSVGSPFKVGTKVCSRSQLTPLIVTRSTPLALAPSFHDDQNKFDLEKEFHPVTLDLQETITDSKNDSIQDMREGITVNQEQEEQDLITRILYNENLRTSEDLACFPPDNNNNISDTFPTMSSLSETKFILGLEKPIEITDYQTE